MLKKFNFSIFAQLDAYFLNQYINQNVFFRRTAKTFLLRAKFNGKCPIAYVLSIKSSML